MAEWVCRSCGGGFPKPILSGGVPVCPWCAEGIGKPLAVESKKSQLERVKRHYGLHSENSSESESQ